MSKIRIYELAKELGLENKALLNLCIQLGMDDKSSHSNSLSDDEAEKIRRFVIRKAVSEKGPSTKEVSKEGQVLTESRVGGTVIRRRKKEEESLSVEPQKEVPTEEELTVGADDSREELEETVNSDSAAEASEQEEVLLEASEEALSSEEKSETISDGIAEEHQAQTLSAEDAAAIAEEEKKDSEDNIEYLAEARKRHDIRAPKVLGKIELPTPVVLTKKPVNGVAGIKSDADSLVDDDSSASAASKKAKKKSKTVEKSDLDEGPLGKRPKKKQILKKEELLDYEDERDAWRVKKVKKKSKDDRTQLEQNAPQKKNIKIDGACSVGELAKQMGVKSSEVISVLMKLGVMAGINQLIDFDTATIVAGEFGHTIQNMEQDLEELVNVISQADAEETLQLRPPVVTVMGHVDHGKTSLLDSIRKTSVTKSEFGGITQHIGAYNVKLSSGGSVTFLDTPGHEAFTAMRSRGAKVTDIVVLVVAADDGVMPQTIEAINHAKAANVPIIVAINKIDKEGANRDKILSQIAEYGLVPEEWGGTTIVCNVSAHTKEGIDTLLENLYLQAEILELKASTARNAVGTVIESKVDRGRGPVITVLVQRGTLKKGDVFVSGSIFGKVRALVTDSDDKAESAGPSIPVEILGASGTPNAGDDFIVFASETQARAVAEKRQQTKRIKELALSEVGGASTTGLTLEKFSELVNTSADVKELALIVKGDVQGSVEAVTSALQQLSNEEVKVRVIHKAVGAISENDVQLASASRAILIGFNVRADSRAAGAIEVEGVQVLYSRVIYDLVDMVNSTVKGLKAPVFREKSLGRVEVRQVFKVPKLGVVAGSYVLDGTILRGSNVRLLRDSKVVYEGKMASLRRFKDDVKEVQSGYECGIGIEGYADIKNGDIIEVYKIEEVAPV